MSGSAFLELETDAGVLAEKIKGISQRRLATWISFATKHEADAFVDYVKAYWLSGQALNCSKDGDTYTSVKAWTSRSDLTVYVRPGVGIPGSLNYLARWDRKSGHEFMEPAFKVFNGSSRIKKAVDANLEHMMEVVFEKKSKK